MKKLFVITASFIALIAINSCSSFKGWGSDFGEGLFDQAKTNVDTVGSELVKGLQEELTNEESRKQLQNYIDSVITQAGTSANKQAVALRDSLLSDYIKIWVSDVVESAVASFNGNLLDDETVLRLKIQISELASGIGSSILNDTTLMRIAALRDTVLGDKTNKLIAAIIDSALTTLSSRLKNDISPQLRENLSFLEKNATWILILIGLIAIGIIWFVWHQKEKYLKMTKLLTYQIAEVPEVQTKEELKNNISKNAKTIGVEDQLRKLLDDQGLLHK